MDVNFRDVATNVSALSHISDTTPVEPAGDWTKIPRDELRAFSERITKAGKHLIDRGADPRSTDGRGNDCLQLAIYNALPDHLAFVQMLIDRIRQLQEDWLRTHVNTFGNAVMVRTQARWIELRAKRSAADCRLCAFRLSSTLHCIRLSMPMYTHLSCPCCCRLECPSINLPI